MKYRDLQGGPTGPKLCREERPLGTIPKHGGPARLSAPPENFLPEHGICPGSWPVGGPASATCPAALHTRVRGRAGGCPGSLPAASMRTVWMGLGAAGRALDLPLTP